MIIEGKDRAREKPKRGRGGNAAVGSDLGVAYQQVHARLSGDGYPAKRAIYSKRNIPELEVLTIYGDEICLIPSLRSGYW